MSGCCSAGDPGATIALRVLFLLSWQHHSTCILISQCQTVSQALNAPPSKAQHKYLPAACSLGYHYQTEVPDVTLECSRQAAVFSRVGTDVRADQGTPQPWARRLRCSRGSGADCHPCCPASNGTDGRQGCCRRRGAKGKIVVVVVGVILVMYFTEKEEFVYVLY